MEYWMIELCSNGRGRRSSRVYGYPATFYSLDDARRLSIDKHRMVFQDSPLREPPVRISKINLDENHGPVILEDKAALISGQHSTKRRRQLDNLLEATRVVVDQVLLGEFDDDAQRALNQLSDVFRNYMGLCVHCGASPTSKKG